MRIVESLNLPSARSEERFRLHFLSPFNDSVPNLTDCVLFFIHPVVICSTVMPRLFLPVMFFCPHQRTNSRWPRRLFLVLLHPNLPGGGSVMLRHVSHCTDPLEGIMSRFHSSAQWLRIITRTKPFSPLHSIMVRLSRQHQTHTSFPVWFPQIHALNHEHQTLWSNNSKSLVLVCMGAYERTHDELCNWPYMFNCIALVKSRCFIVILCHYAGGK